MSRGAIWLQKVGKMEMRVSEGISSDFQDTGYGIGKLLSGNNEEGFDDKVPPTHILSTYFGYFSDIDPQNGHVGPLVGFISKN